MNAQTIKCLVESSNSFQAVASNKSPTTVNQRVIEANATRVYLAFWTGTLGGRYLLGPEDAANVTLPFDINGANQLVEFWIDKHKGLVQMAWICNPLVPSNINILELFYIG